MKEADARSWLKMLLLPPLKGRNEKKKKRSNTQQHAGAGKRGGLSKASPSLFQKERGKRRNERNPSFEAGEEEEEEEEEKEEEEGGGERQGRCSVRE